MRAGGKGGGSHHLASLTDSKYSVTRTAGVIGAYSFSRFFPQVNLRVEATSQPWFTCLFLQLRLPCCTIATKKTFRTTPRIRLDPNQRVYYRLETQLSIYSEIESNVATQSFGIWRCKELRLFKLLHRELASHPGFLFLRSTARVKFITSCRSLCTQIYSNVPPTVCFEHIMVWF